jgi:hypothetical protein
MHDQNRQKVYALRWAVALMLGLGLLGCSRKPEKQILGKWEAQKFTIGDKEEAFPPGELVFDFQKDGNVAVTELNVTDQVTYKFTDKETMEFTEPDGTPFTVKVSITGDRMTLEILEFNKKFELKRIK